MMQKKNPNFAEIIESLRKGKIISLWLIGFMKENKTKGNKFSKFVFSNHATSYKRHTKVHFSVCDNASMLAIKTQVFLFAKHSRLPFIECITENK